MHTDVYQRSDYLGVAETTLPLLNGYVKKLPLVAKAAGGLIHAIEEILIRGSRDGDFRTGIDALQLYVSVLSLSYLHLSNRHTLSTTYGQDMTEAAWLDARREHVTDMILSFCHAKN